MLNLALIVEVTLKFVLSLGVLLLLGWAVNVWTPLIMSQAGMMPNPAPRRRFSTFAIALAVCTATAATYSLSFGPTQPSFADAIAAGFLATFCVTQGIFAVRSRLPRT